MNARPAGRVEADELIANFLTELEKREARLLGWGFVDGAFEDSELDDLARDFLERADGWGSFPRPDALVEALETLRLIFPFRDQGRWRYRSRSAETIRLLARLRQLFPRHVASGTWQSAPTLVADFRYLSRPRVFPTRDRTVQEALAEIPAGPPARERAVHALIGERRLAAFQIRGLGRIFSEFDRPTAGGSGTVVCAGTGSGKTLTFYVPVLASIAEDREAAPFVRCLALYPRNELLKDQFTEAYRLCRSLDAIAVASRGRKLRIGALFGPTPRSLEAFGSPWPPDGWSRRTGGYLCPLMRCPTCGAETIWRDDDRSAGLERLRCYEHDDHPPIEGNEVALTRRSLLQAPPDVLFTTTEMLNQRLCDSRFHRLFGVGLPPDRRPRSFLLDEVHTYSGTSGAQTAYLLRRWRRRADCNPHFVGLSATLREAPQFFANLVGLAQPTVEEISVRADEATRSGIEHLLALRGNPASGTSLLSVTLQTAMLLSRTLDPRGSDASGGLYGRKTFLFTDDLDVTNRLFFDLRDAEGQDSFGRPLAARAGGSLANLRASVGPDAERRFRDGQTWSLCERIGHVLSPEAPKRIARTSSQDAGVDQEADQIVATASLEVGFNDPYVGAVVQHKAPLDAASFLQRKGRAGRLQRMRPWTIVALSDYGRDRRAYQAYDLLFDPELPARELPLGNRHIQRMQATFAMMEWLDKQLDGLRFRGSVRQDLSLPAHERSAHEREAVEERQRRIATLLEETLTLPERQRELIGYLKEALRFENDAVEAVLWDPPRSLLTIVIPTALRRLRCQWRTCAIDGVAGAEYREANAPLPEFVPRALFQELSVPEVTIVTPPTRPGDGEGRYPMDVAQAVGEFAPGRVSRRFGIQNRYTRHWIPVGALDRGGPRDVALSTFSPHDRTESLGRFEYWNEQGERSAIECLRPWELRLHAPPQNVRDSSNAFAQWRTQLAPWIDGMSLGAPVGETWSELVADVRFHLHADGCPIEVRRFAVGSSFGILLETGERIEGEARFVDDVGAPVALGFAHEADAVSLRLRLPDDLPLAVTENAPLLRRLRPARFRDLVRSSPALQSVANFFVREWLAEAFLCAFAAEVAERGDAARLLDPDRSESARESVEKVLRSFFEAAPAAEEEAQDSPQETASGDREDAGHTGRETRRMLIHSLEALHHPATVPALLQAAAALHAPVDAAWNDWLDESFRATIGGAAIEAIQRLCPEVDVREILLDVSAGPRPPGCIDVLEGLAEIWISERAVGGGGILEKFGGRYAEAPQNFFDLMTRALEHNDFEIADTELERYFKSVTIEPRSPLARAAADVRRSHEDSHERLARAFDSFLSELRAAGFFASHATVAALATRALRPGSSAEVDQVIHRLVAEWRRLEEQCGVEIDGRHFAWIASDDPALAQRLRDVLDAPLPARSQLLAMLHGLLWPRGSAVHGRHLRTFNPFAETPDPVPDLVRMALPASEAGRTLNSESDAVAIIEALSRDGAVRACAIEAETARRAILLLAGATVDIGATLASPRLRGATRGPAGTTLEFRVEELDR
jgi:hypothetical protein